MANPTPDLPTSLAEAANKFARFLADNGYSPNIRWLVADDAVIGSRCDIWVRDSKTDKGIAEANRRYAAGLSKELGVALIAHCTTGAETFASVFVPEDDTDAQYALMGRGLKLSCPAKVIRASAVANPIRWWWLKLRNRKQVVRL